MLPKALSAAELLATATSRRPVVVVELAAVIRTVSLGALNCCTLLHFYHRMLVLLDLLV